MPPDRTVLLLHGLWLASPAMHRLGSGLRAAGWRTEAFGYPSITGDTTATVERLVERLRADPPAAIVGHSLGGLVALEALRRAAELRVGRVVCLGSPLAGSRAAGGVAERIPAGRRMLGQHLPLLLAGAGTLPAGLEVGMIAGCKPRGLGGVVARFDCEHDGTVALPETRIDGLADHIVLPASHSGLIFSDAAVAQSIAFLRAGRFDHPGEGRAAGIA